MRVLLSAYACEPNRGSEPGVGWSWATCLARRGSEVWVITRANNADVLQASAECSRYPNLHFVYYDLPAWARWWKRGQRGVYLYYFLWQLGAYACARQLVSQLRFDYVHHLTLGGFRAPSFLGFLGLPFIIGPIGGGERAPVRLRKSFPWRAKITDCLRDIANAAALLDPLLRACYKRSRLILCKTRESAQLIPRAFADRVRVQREIGVASVERSSPHRPLGNSVSVLYIGRLIYWKGVHLALRAFAQFVQHHPQATLTIIGEGAEREWLQRLANELSLSGSVRWIPRIAYNELSSQYETHDLFLFPSLRESGGTVVLEALSTWFAGGLSRFGRTG